MPEVLLILAIPYASDEHSSVLSFIVPGGQTAHDPSMFTIWFEEQVSPHLY